MTNIDAACMLATAIRKTTTASFSSYPILHHLRSNHSSSLTHEIILSFHHSNHKTKRHETSNLSSSSFTSNRHKHHQFVAGVIHLQRSRLGNRVFDVVGHNRDLIVDFEVVALFVVCCVTEGIDGVVGDGGDAHIAVDFDPTFCVERGAGHEGGVGKVSGCGDDEGCFEGFAIIELNS